MSALPFAYAWRWKGGVTWKLTLNKNPNAHRDIEIKELFDHSELAATVIEQQRIITALSEDASKAAELALEVERLRTELEGIAASADDDDGWTSDGHERCTEAARAALDAKP